MNNTNTTIAFYITAGGKARRMNGRIKAFVEVGGKRIIDSNLEEIPKEVSKIGIITNEPHKFEEYKNRGILIVSDKYKDIGPLAGLHAALYSSKSDAVIISASDMPNINSSIINSLIESYKELSVEAIVPIINGKIEPLFAIYSKNILTKLEEFIDEGQTYAVRAFLRTIKVQYLEFIGDEEAFVNINSVEDLY